MEDFNERLNKISHKRLKKIDKVRFSFFQNHGAFFEERKIIHTEKNDVKYQIRKYLSNIIKKQFFNDSFDENILNEMSIEDNIINVYFVIGDISSI